MMEKLKFLLAPILFGWLASCGNSSNDAKLDELDENLVSVENLELTGASQKGPFLEGTSVVAYELENGKTLKQTGKAFSGNINGNDGVYKIPSISLVSQYAFLMATGSYRNEVTGKNSDKSITLRAITDLSSRKTANINLMTHLEYDRVVYLVTKEGLTVREAKRKAEREIFRAFHIESDEFNDYSEDLSVFGTRNANAALLAISILIQNSGNSDELSVFVSKFSSDLEKDSIWDDSATRIKIADWASVMQLSGDIKDIRNNITAWKLGDVPDFEHYVRNFWASEYKLGVCSEKNEGEFKADSIKTSKNFYEGSSLRFVCRKGEWLVLDVEESDTYGWSHGRDGEIKKGQITETVYVFDSTENKWRIASDIERIVGGCVTANDEKFVQILSETSGETGVFFCKNRSWNFSDSLLMDTRGWAAGKNGDVAFGDSTKLCLVYNEGWRYSSTGLDCNEKFFGCTDANEQKMVEYENKQYFCLCNDWLYSKEGFIGKVLDGVECNQENQNVLKKNIASRSGYSICKGELSLSESTGKDEYFFEVSRHNTYYGDENEFYASCIKLWFNWTDAYDKEIEFFTSKCEKDLLIEKLDDDTYYCYDGRWLKSLEGQSCDPQKVKKFYDETVGDLICYNDKFQRREKLIGEDCSSDLEVRGDLACINGRWNSYWNIVNEPCTGKYAVVFGEDALQCQNNLWTQVGSAKGAPCITEMEIGGNLVCYDNSWIDFKQLAGKECSEHLSVLECQEKDVLICYDNSWVDFNQLTGKECTEHLSVLENPKTNALHVCYNGSYLKKDGLVGLACDGELKLIPDLACYEGKFILKYQFQGERCNQEGLDLNLDEYSYKCLDGLWRKPCPKEPNPWYVDPLERCFDGYLYYIGENGSRKFPCEEGETAGYNDLYVCRDGYFEMRKF